MKLFFTHLKEAWNILKNWNYEPSEEEQRALWRVELNMLYDRVAYLEDKLKSVETEEERRIKRCGHTKGGRRVKGRPLIVRDYSLACHTFIDGRTRIWCLNGCGFEAWNGDKNWEQAYEMFKQSTNTHSSSETPSRKGPFPNVEFSLGEGLIKLEEDESPIKGALKKEEYKGELYT